MLRTEGQKGYFYDIPFDPAATYKTFRDGVEFYSSEMGNSFIGGPPVIYKYHEKTAGPPGRVPSGKKL